MERPLNRGDLVELADRAWTVVDPEGTHEAEERRWLEELLVERGEGFPVRTEAALGAHLVAAVRASVDGYAPPELEAVACVAGFLGTHPERTVLDEGVLGEALHEGLGPELPARIDRWLRTRRELAEPAEPGPRPPGPRHWEH